MIQLIYNSEKKKILKKLNEQYGITSLPYTLAKTSKDKIRGYSGSLTQEQIKNLNQQAKIEALGIYLLTDHQQQGLRLSLDAIHIFQSQITKNILTLNNQQLKEWFNGEDLLLTEEWKQQENTFKIIKYKDDFIGSAKLTDEKLINYLPKERRIKSQ